LEALQSAAIHNLHVLFDLDHNGWTPLHEAARGGHVSIVEFLVHHAEAEGVAPSTFVNIVSNFGHGWSALALAIQHNGEDHPVTRMLRDFGGQVVYPRR
jgi:prolyl 4-hydroxylase